MLEISLWICRELVWISPSQGAAVKLPAEQHASQGPLEGM